MRVDEHLGAGVMTSPSRHAGTRNRTTGRTLSINVVKKSEFQAAQYAAFRGRRTWTPLRSSSLYFSFYCSVAAVGTAVDAGTEGRWGWRFIQPVLDAWAAEKAYFPSYDTGGDGPKATDELLTDDGGRAWRRVVYRRSKTVSGQRNIRLLLADVDGTLVTKDEVLTRR
jgi:Glucose-6-phosphate dehydrogenase, C-terminal domain